MVLYVPCVPNVPANQKPRRQSSKRYSVFGVRFFTTNHCQLNHCRKNINLKTMQRKIQFVLFILITHINAFPQGELIGHSKSGNPIYSYGERETDSLQPVIGDTNTVDIIDEHISKFFGDSEITVFHELISDLIHVDVFVIKANEDRNYHILMTCGMSSLSMSVPEGLEGLAYAEIVILLPETWSLDHSDFEDENVYWPIRQLKVLARFPHLYKTWLGFGHTIANGNPAERMSENCNFKGSLIIPSINLPEDFMIIETNDKKINVYSMIPIYAEEMDFKLRKGTDKLLKKFFTNGVSEVIDINRINTCL